MKAIKYIVTILITVSFFSCEKDNFDIQHTKEGQDFNIPINPKDTAGLVVPEGYAMVVMGESQTKTRAVTSSDRISHLQYLIYESTATGYQLYKKEVVFESFGTKNWPCDAQIEILPKGKEWKVVFLGNMSKSIFGNSQTEEVLTGTNVGTSYYTDARIILPKVEFSNQTMYHFAESNFSTNAATVEVPLVLKRIVSRHDIYQEGPALMNEYYEQVLKDKLYKDIFTASNSVFRYQLKDCILKEVIWPITYMGLQAVTTPDNYKTSYKSVKWYLENPSMYNQAYLTGWADIVSDTRDALGFLPLDDYVNNYYLNLAEYLYEVFVEDSDPTIIESVLSQICTENNEDFITNAQKKISTFFKANYRSGTLLPWSGNAIIDRTAVPSIIDFSFNVIQSDNAGLKYYNGNTRTNGRNYFSVVTLPDASADSKLTFNKIYITDFTNSGGGIDQLPSVDKKTEISGSPLNGGPFLQNMKYDCILKLTSATLTNRTSWTPYTNNWQDVNLSYYNILTSLSLVDDSKGTITIGSSSFKKTLCTNQVYGGDKYFARVSAELLIPLTKVLCSIHNMTPGQITTDLTKTLRFPFSLKAPIFQDNIVVTMAWEDAVSNPEP